MSNRTLNQVDHAAEYRVSHLEQIEALTATELDDRTRILRFTRAAGITDFTASYVIERREKTSVACALWYFGYPRKSLFASLPGCRCPVLEGLDGVPSSIPLDWSPTAPAVRPRPI